MVKEREDFDSVYDLVNSPKLAELLRVFERSLKLTLRTSAPGTVVTYDATTQKANVILDFATILKNSSLPFGEEQAATIILPNIPVHFKRSMGGQVWETDPILPGDTGQLIACDRSLEAWMKIGAETDPVAYVTHSFNDAVFYPGLHPDTDPITPATSLVAKVIEAPLINLGFGAVDFLIKGTTLSTALTAILTTLAATPPATDPATTQALANANNVAIIAIATAIQTNLSTKTSTV